MSPWCSLWTLYLSHVRLSYLRRLGSRLLLSTICDVNIIIYIIVRAQLLPIGCWFYFPGLMYEINARCWYCSEVTLAMSCLFLGEMLSQIAWTCVVPVNACLIQSAEHSFSAKPWPFRFFVFFTLCCPNEIVFPWELRVAFPKESQLQQSRATQPYLIIKCILGVFVFP